jgi:hypothetical protein
MLFIISLIFILVSLHQYNTKKIVLPIRTTVINNNNNNNNEDISKYFLPKELYTEILVGTPPQYLIMNINTNNHLFYLSSNECYEKIPPFSYNYSNSSSFHLITYRYGVESYDYEYEEESYDNDEYGVGIYARDFFSFYNSTDLKTNITKNDFGFYYTSYSTFNQKAKICGTIGLGLAQQNINYNMDIFFNELKNKGLIDEYSWTYTYFIKKNNKIINNPEINNKYIIDNFDGMLILGNIKDFYTNDDENNDYVSIPAAIVNNGLKWDIVFNRIYSNNKDLNSINKDITAELSINYDYIISPEEYFIELILPFFNSYIEKKNCQFREIKKSVDIYEILYCNGNVFTIQDMKKFPTLYFYHREFNYTFELNYEDLFEEINNDIYFLVVKNIGNFNKDIWKLGKTFLNKYQFSFNQDSKMISFYPYRNNYNYKIDEDERNNKKNKKFNLSYIWIVICIACLLFGIYIGTKIVIKNRKKRANELEDEYDYKDEKEDNNTNLINYMA